MEQARTAGEGWAVLGRRKVLQDVCWAPHLRRQPLCLVGGVGCRASFSLKCRFDGIV